jgi:glycosyltransferase involved in cell wall biosynthesis
MRLLVVLEDRVLVSPEGTTWSTAGLAAQAWSRYLEVFDTVQFVARATPVAEPPPGSTRVDTSRATLVGIPTFHHPLGLLFRYRAVRRSLNAAIVDSDAVMLKVPGTLANLAMPILLRTHRPFGVNVVGDPAEVMQGGIGPPLLRPALRRWFVWQTLRQCREAVVAIYVGKEVLPARYPPGPTTTFASVSNVDLGDDAFGVPWTDVRATGPFQLVTVASLEQPYKGVDILLRAVSALHSSGIHVELTIVGEGRLRDRLGRLARSLGIAERVRFVGSVPGPAAVRTVLSGADLFVLASRTEGLPRAMVEAMALGLPSIGTSVGGIPELLPPEDRVRSEDPDALANLFRSVLADPARRVAMSRRNIEMAQEYRATLLVPRQRALYEQLAEMTLASAKDR